MRTCQSALRFHPLHFWHTCGQILRLDREVLKHRQGGLDLEGFLNFGLQGLETTQRIQPQGRSARLRNSSPSISAQAVGLPGKFQWL